MPRTTSAATSARGRRRGRGARPDTNSVVAKISQIVGANEALQQENRELRSEVERLRSELSEIGSALGRLSGGQRRGRGRQPVEIAGLVEVKPKRQRKPITDPVILERRKQALAKARAARAEKLAAARAAGNGASAGE